MKPLLFLNIIFFVISLNCASHHAIGRDIIPAETFESRIRDGKCALIISRNFDISLEEIKEDQLENILNNNIFINKKSKYKSPRMSEYIIFKIIIENTGDMPLEIEEMKLQYNSTILKPLSADDLKKTNSPAADSAINFNEFLNLYKLDAKDICENDIDFQRDIIKNLEKRIHPGDKVLLFTVFNWLPVQIRKFNLSIAIKSDIYQKIIDFKLRRFEYRQSGKDFIKPEKEENE